MSHIVELHDQIERDADFERDIFDQQNAYRMLYHGHVRPQRYKLLFVGFLISLGVGLNLFILPSANEYTARRLATSNLGVEALTTMSFFIHAFFGIGLTLFVREFGLKATALTIAFAQILGSISTYIGIIQDAPNKCVSMVLTGQLIDAFAFAAVIECISVFAAPWQRDGKILVSGILYFSLYLGVSISNASLGIPDDIPEQFKRFMISRISIALTVIVLVSCLIKKSPVMPIHISAAIRCQGTPWNRISNGIKVFYRDIDLLLLQNSYAIYFALANSTMLLLRNIITIELPNVLSSAHWILAATALTGAIGILCGAILANTKSKPKMLAGCLITMSSSLMAMFTFAATSLKSVPLSAMFAIFWSITGFAWLAIGIKYVTDLAHAISECVVPTFSMVAGSFYTVIITTVCGWILKVFGFMFVGYFLATLYGVSLLFLLMSKDRR